MSRDASNYLILVEKILGKTKEVTGDCQGELQALRHRQLRALLRTDFGKAGGFGVIRYCWVSVLGVG